LADKSTFLRQTSGVGKVTVGESSVLLNAAQGDKARKYVRELEELRVALKSKFWNEEEQEITGELTTALR
jgi:hypothetical protein